MCEDEDMWARPPDGWRILTAQELSGALLKALRALCGVSIFEFASDAGVGSATLKRAEAGGDPAGLRRLNREKILAAYSKRGISVYVDQFGKFIIRCEPPDVRPVTDAKLLALNNKRQVAKAKRDKERSRELLVMYVLATEPFNHSG